MRRALAHSLSVFGLLTIGAPARATIPPPEDFDIPTGRGPKLLFKSVDDRGRPVVPDRLSCQAVYYPPSPDYGPLVTPCNGWDDNLFRFSKDGSVEIEVRHEPAFADHGPVCKRSFIRAHKGTRQSGPIIYERYDTPAWKRMVFPTSRLKRSIPHGPPVITIEGVETNPNPSSSRQARVRLFVDVGAPGRHAPRVDWCIGTRPGSPLNYVFAGVARNYRTVAICPETSECNIATYWLEITSANAPGAVEGWEADFSRFPFKDYPRIKPP